MKYSLSEITEVIKNRRTIYPEFYSTRKVHKEIVENLLNNAIWAPNHGMTQPWRFKVFTGEGLKKLSNFQSELYKEKFTGANFNDKKFYKLKEWPLKTSVVIGITMTPDPNGRIKTIEEIEATSCAVQNMMLSATAYGIGSYWSSGGVTYMEETKDFLGINKDDQCLGFLYLGYPENDWPKSQRRPIEYVTEWIES